MHLLYVDESGDDGFSASGVYSDPNAQSKVFIRTGLALHGWKWRSLNQEITALRFKHRIPGNIEVHATEIRRGKDRIYDKKTGKKKEVPNWFGITYPDFNGRMQIIKDFCDLIAGFDGLTLICVVIDKSKINQAILPENRSPKNASWELLIERYNLYLDRERDKIGIIISDAIQDKIEKVHRDFARAIYENSLFVKSYHFVESILFEPSDSSNLLQLVDIASYACYKMFNNGDSKYYDIVKGKLLTNGIGQIDGAGLKIWP